MADLTIVHADGTTHTATFDRPGLYDYYRLIGCEMIQLINLPDGREMIINEEAKMTTGPASARNETATEAARGSLMTGDWIAGTAVIQPGGTLE